MDLEELERQGDAIARPQGGGPLTVVVCDTRYDGDPFPAKRPRFDSRTKRSYNDKGYEAELERVAWLLQAARRVSAPVAGHVDVAVTFYRGSRARVDVDNLLKTVLDAATGVLWLDDSQVTHVDARKVLGCGKRCSTRLIVRTVAS